MSVRSRNSLAVALMLGMIIAPWIFGLPDSPVAAIYLEVALAGFTLGLIAPKRGWLFAIAGTLPLSGLYAFWSIATKAIDGSWHPSPAQEVGPWLLLAVAGVSGALSEYAAWMVSRHRGDGDQTKTGKV